MTGWIGRHVILHIAFVSSFVANQNYAAYASSKAAISHLIRVLAREWAPRNIRVNALHPGVIDTEMGQKTIDTGARMLTGNNRDLALERSIQRHPLGRLGTVDDIARAILFLASDDARFMTGSSLVVDGGLTAA